MENQYFKENVPSNQDQVVERVNDSFDHMAQDVKNDVHTDNQTSQQSHQNIMNAIDEAVDVFNNNPWNEQ